MSKFFDHDGPMVCELRVAPIQEEVGRNLATKVNMPNRYDDVVMVQRLLQRAAARLNVRSIHPGLADGKISASPRRSSTVEAILAYQRRLSGFTPNGVVAPESTTMISLSNDAGYIPSNPNMSVVSLNRDYLGRTINWICPNGFHKKSANHCAHFVAHVFRIGNGYTCRSLVKDTGVNSSPSGFGANVRVHELFAMCPEVEEIVTCPPPQRLGLIFVSKQTNFGEVRASDKTIVRSAVHGMRMRNIPKKHVGVLLNGQVWHYSNTRDYVIRQTVSDFLFHYRNQTNAVWYGKPPASAFTALSN